MRICLLARHVGLEGGGVGRVAQELYKGLVKRGHTVRVLEVKGDELVDYFKFTALDIPRKLPKDFDVYHAISPMEAIWLPKERSVVTFHDLFLMTHPDKTGAGLGQSILKRKIGEWYWAFACKRAVRAKYVTCNSEQTKENIKAYLNTDSKIVHPGINPSLVPLRKRDDILRIGYLGQLDRRKRVDLLVRAFHESSLNGELVIAGKGFDRPMLERMAEGDRRIKFLGFIPDSQLHDFFTSLDYFCSASALEGLGLIFLEAMACKKRVIVLEDAVIPDEIKSRCLVTDDLKNLFNNFSLISADGVDSNYEFAKTFNWDNFVTAHESLYSQIVEQFAKPTRESAILRLIRRFVPIGLRQDIGFWTAKQAGRSKILAYPYFFMLFGYAPKGLKLLPDGDCSVTYEGSEIKAPRDAIFTFMEVLQQNIYEKHWTPKSSDVVIDVGAYVGMFSIKVAPKVKKVIAVEPHDANFRYLCANTRDSPNIIKSHLAASDKKGEATLFLSKASTCHTLVTDHKGSMPVLTDTLDNITRELGYEQVDFIKIDAEGAELSILRGTERLLRGKIKLAVAAYHNQENGQPEKLGIVKFLTELGFNIRDEKGYLYCDKGANA